METNVNSSESMIVVDNNNVEEEEKRATKNIDASKKIDNQSTTADDTIDDGISSASSSSDFNADQQEIVAPSPTKESSSSSEWEDILGSGELFRKVLKRSANSADVKKKPVKDDLVTLRVEGELEDGTEVDSYQKLSFLLGHSDVISAFDLCVPFMEVGEIDSVRTSARFAYGKVGNRDAEIPPNATVSYTIELLSVESGPNFDQMDADELLIWVNKKRERGNYYFKREEYASAVDLYNRALNLLQMEPAKTEDERRRITDSRVTVYNNLAAAQLKIEAWNAAITSLRYCTTMQPNNVKAHFRLAKAYAGQNEHQAAIGAYKNALALDKDNKAIQMALEHEKQLMKSENDRSRAVYKRMFGGESAQSKEANSKWRSIAQWWKNRGVVANTTTILAITAAAGAVIARYFSTPRA